MTATDAGSWLTEQSAEREVSVLFADLVGSTLLVNQLPLKDYAELMTELLQVLILSCAAQDGEVLQHQGDAVVAIWEGRDAHQALDVACRIHERSAGLRLAQRLELQLSMRAGVASGAVMMGQVGGAITAYGRPMNLASRLCDASTAGETLVCERTRQLAPAWGYETPPRKALRSFPATQVARLVVSPSQGKMKTS